ncbi:hypothetical protein [Janthinobacterium sp. J1-1]|uniref:hypothetical protein n=1 Tax=unclassified Janthinobacterium TaxID=2610881 RepID=UPI0028123F4D|nr:hypothetical protein [Janthinobacterium sp. J1-1]
MDKRLLTALKATARAAFNKLLNQAAKIKPNKIKQLQNHLSTAENNFQDFAISSFVHNCAAMIISASLVLRFLQ